MNKSIITDSEIFLQNQRDAEIAQVPLSALKGLLLSVLVEGVILHREGLCGVTAEAVIQSDSSLKAKGG